MLDGAMVDHKIFVYNAARDNNLAALKVSVLIVLWAFAYLFSIINSLQWMIRRVRYTSLLLSENADFFSWNHLIWFRPCFALLFSCSIYVCFFFCSSFWRLNEYTRCCSTYHFDEYNEISKYHYISIIIRPCADVLFVLYS